MIIVEAVREKSHYLTRQHFTVITDQRSVASMFSNEKRTKIQNAKIQVLRLKHSTLDNTIKYHPGKEKVVPDTFSRAFTCLLINSSTLVDNYNGLCHPGITRFLHFLRGKKKVPFFYGGCKNGVFFMQNLC